MSEMTDTLATDLATIAGATPEALAALRMKYQFRCQRDREALSAIDAAILEDMEATGVTVLRVTDALELRVVVDKTTRNVRGTQRHTLRALFEAVNGDVDAAADLLCSDPFKPAACRTVLDPGVYSQLFETVVKTRLEGKPLRKLSVVNPKLLEGLGVE